MPVSSEYKRCCFIAKASSLCRSAVQRANSPCNVLPPPSSFETVKISKPLKSGAFGLFFVARCIVKMFLAQHSAHDRW